MNTPELTGRQAAACVMLEAIRQIGGPLDNIEVAACAHVLKLTLGSVDSTTPPDPVAILRAAARVFRRTADLIDESAGDIARVKADADAEALRTGAGLLGGEERGAA